ncbi:hypothetical protein STEG23_016933, partial [Scotinomys teguina]
MIPKPVRAEILRKFKIAVKLCLDYYSLRLDHLSQQPFFSKPSIVTNLHSTENDDSSVYHIFINYSTVDGHLLLCVYCKQSIVSMEDQDISV